jgi:septum formation protein
MLTLVLPGNTHPGMPELILASTSIYRRQLMLRLGLPFRAEAPRCDEEALKGKHRDPRTLADFLAHEKANSLRTAFPGATIIGSDQMAVHRNIILGKPGTAENARAQLKAMQGSTHELLTAVVVLHPGTVWRHLDITRMTMRVLTDEQIARYVAADNPVDCAGAYKLEQRGISLFSKIESQDHSAITGLPLLALTGYLTEIGYTIP